MKFVVELEDVSGIVVDPGPEPVSADCYGPGSGPVAGVGPAVEVA